MIMMMMMNVDGYIDMGVLRAQDDTREIRVVCSISLRLYVHE